ncbi:MAG: hypothetical protein V3T83_06115 [Acidobacteriota bacterium]
MDSLSLETKYRFTDLNSRASRLLAKALGQDEKILLEIETGKLHPAMAAWGLWGEEEDLASLSDEIEQERSRS